MLDAAFPADIVAVLGDFLARTEGASEVTLLLADYDLQQLRPLAAGDASRLVAGEPVPINNSAAGQAYQTQSNVTVPAGGHIEVHVPVTLRDERLGVLSVRLSNPMDGEVLEGLAAVGTTLAYVILTASRYTDLFEVARRRWPLSLEAEVQWGLQPVRAFGGDLLALAGQLVPAYDVGGDSYDWVVNRQTASISATDAMGHGLNASLLGALTVTALRNARRASHPIADRVAMADRAVQRQFGGSQFVTAFCMDIDLPSSTAVAVNAGHPAPWRIRGRRASRVEVEPQLPIGLFEDTEYAAQPFELEPGDRLALISDGVLEARPEGGEQFGAVRLEAALLATVGDQPHEAVRRIVHTLLDYQQGDLRDDATILVLDWFGEQDRNGDGTGGNGSVTEEAHS